MIKEVLKLLLEGEAIRTEEIAVVLGASEAEVQDALQQLETEQVLLGWR